MASVGGHAVTSTDHLSGMAAGVSCSLTTAYYVVEGYGVPQVNIWPPEASHSETEELPEAQGDFCQAAVSLSSSMACELILAACLFKRNSICPQQELNWWGRMGRG